MFVRIHFESDLVLVLNHVKHLGKVAPSKIKHLGAVPLISGFKERSVSSSDYFFV